MAGGDLRPQHLGAMLLDAALAGRIAVGLIADGVHVQRAPAVVAARAAGHRLLLVTDAVAAAGMPDGEYRLGGRVVRSASGRVTDEDGRLAGSALRPLQAVRNLAGWTGSALVDVLPAMTSRAADVLGCHELGRIAEGALADLIVLTPDATLSRRGSAAASCTTVPRTPAECGGRPLVGGPSALTVSQIQVGALSEPR